MKNHKSMRLGAAAAALAAVTAVAVSGSATASPPERGVTDVIKMKFNNQQGPFFEHPDSISDGTSLRIVNKTDPQQIGPHTFSLVRASKLPTREQRRRCGFLELRVCREVAEAHEVDPQTFDVGEPDVDNGLVGWDLRFDGEGRHGDTWYTETEGETEERLVTSQQNQLIFFCVVHPEMRGKIPIIR